MDSPRYASGEAPMLGDLVTPQPRRFIQEEYVVSAIDGAFVTADYTGATALDYESYSLAIDTLHLIRRRHNTPSIIKRAGEAITRAISAIREKSSHTHASAYFSPLLVHKIKNQLLLLTDSWTYRPRDHVFSIYRVREGR